MPKGKSGQQGNRRSGGTPRKGQGTGPQQGGDRGQRGQDRRQGNPR
jgi:hypothetical protein